ncbi:hypothetical protein F4818DRAFT_437658 [Hypoxylon cercidicola]|nr:hypothetical protein F4818DRAFT_437658 [Hypoxylon cercidicola]
MARNNQPVPAIICAENIAALHVLHSRPNQHNAVPAQPSSNPVTNSQSRSADYTLPFEKERSLAGTLAFLAYAKEDINYIPAVCIEENPSAACLNVLIAVNKKTESDGRDILEKSKQRFEDIFAVLAQLDDGAHHVEKDMFRAIVSMCSVRILHRLSLKRNERTKARQSIKETLQTVDKCLNDIELEEHRHLLSTSNSFSRRAREVIELVDSWARHQTSLELEKLVDGINRLRGVGNLDALFSKINDRDMHRDSRKSLLNMINKVARYREAARILYRMAKKYPLVRRMRVELVQLPGKAFDKGRDRSGYTPNLDTNISAINGLEKNEKNFAYICRLMDSTKTDANRRFADRTRKTLREAKIHAEIQLLYYCKLYITHARRPRVVCSSKDACWLCNEFILTYKEIHIPRGHGKLYSGWRLPSLPEPEFDNIAGRFNRRLMEFLKSSIKTLFERKEKTIYKDPIESTLLTYIWSTSTLPTTAPAEADMADKHVGVVVLPSDKGVTLEEGVTQKPQGKENEVSEKVLAEPRPSVPETSPIRREGSKDVPPPQRTSPVPRSATSSPIQPDVSKKRAKTKYRRIKHGKTSSLHTAGLFEIQVEYAGNPNPKAPSGHRKRLAYAIDMLTANEAGELRSRGKVPIIDASSLDKNEVDHRTDRDGFFYLSSGDAVLRVFLERVGTET